MSHLQVLSAAGVIRLSKRGGFCPACRLVQTGDAPQELAPPALIALALLLVAALAWAVTLARSSSMHDVHMGLGSVSPFVAAWTLMLAAMMLPSATPLVFQFARNVEGRRGWQAASAVVGLSYLGIWLAFGVACYALYSALGMPWSTQPVVGGAVLVLAGLYAFTPLKRRCEAWCRELSALHSLPFNLMRAALVAGVRYGLSCVGCSAVVMVAMLLIGMSNLIWMLALTLVMLTYRFAPAPFLRWSQVTLSAALMALGVVYSIVAS